MEPVHRLTQLRLAELRPHALQKAQLCVCALPQEKVAEPLLTARADQQIHIRRRPGVATRR